MTSETVWLIIVFLSTLSLRRATCRNSQNIKGHTISIHALLAESDLYTIPETLVPRQFLSTLSLRRATWHWLWHLAHTRHFYPRSPCGERPNGCATIPNFRYFYPRSPCGERLTSVLPTIPAPAISIHALLAESDLSKSAIVDLLT